MTICDVAPEFSDLGIEDPLSIALGDPQRSFISVRFGLLGPRAMPPFGNNLVDIDPAAVVEDFIASVTRCKQPCILNAQVTDFRRHVTDIHLFERLVTKIGRPAATAFRTVATRTITV